MDENLNSSTKNDTEVKHSKMKVWVVVCSIIAAISLLLSYFLYSFIISGEEKLSIRNELTLAMDDSISKVDAYGVTIRIENFEGEASGFIVCGDSKSCFISPDNTPPSDEASELTAIDLMVAMSKVIPLTPSELLFIDIDKKIVDDKVIYTEVSNGYVAEYVVVDGILSEYYATTQDGKSASFFYEYDSYLHGSV